MKHVSVIAGIALAWLVSVAAAHDYQLRALKIDHPFARATPPGARSGGVFLTVENTGGAADRLLGISTPVAGAAELHEMTLDGGVMRMRAVSGMEVKPGDKLELKPGGYHAMLSDLKRPLKVGDHFPLTLTFERAGAIEVSVWVEEMGARSGHSR